MLTAEAGSSPVACSSSSADAKTAWLPQEIALDGHGYVLAGSDVRTAGPSGARARLLPARDERPDIFACGDRPVESGEAAAVGEAAWRSRSCAKYVKDAAAAGSLPRPAAV